MYCLPALDLLLTVAEAGWLRPYWSTAIEAEWLRNGIANRPDQELGLRRRCAAQRRAFPDAVVDGAPALEPPPALPDAKDLHVVETAVHAGLRVIVTANVRHFPAAVLAPYKVKALHPDAVLDGLAATAVLGRGSIRSPAAAAADDRCRACGQPAPPRRRPPPHRGPHRTASRLTRVAAGGRWETAAAGASAATTGCPGSDVPAAARLERAGGTYERENPQETGERTAAEFSRAHPHANPGFGAALARFEERMARAEQPVPPASGGEVRPAA